MSENTKRYIISSLITFVTTAAIAIGAQLEVTEEIHLTSAFLISLLGVGVRAGFKAAFESLMRLMTGSRH